MVPAFSKLTVQWKKHKTCNQFLEEQNCKMFWGTNPSAHLPRFIALLPRGLTVYT